MEDKFIGPRKVLTVVEDDLKTKSGGKVLLVTFDGGYKELITEKAFNLLATSVPSDFTDLRKRKFKDMVLDILTIINDYSITGEEVDPLCHNIQNELYHSFNRAVSFLLTRDDASFKPGVNPVTERSILEIDKILKAIPAPVASPVVGPSADTAPAN